MKNWRVVQTSPLVCLMVVNFLLLILKITVRGSVLGSKGKDTINRVVWSGSLFDWYLVLDTWIKENVERQNGIDHWRQGLLHLFIEETSSICEYNRILIVLECCQRLTGMLISTKDAFYGENNHATCPLLPQRHDRVSITGGSQDATEQGAG